jgi:hypothetical protein
LVFLYFPATHATHGPPSGPVYPTLHGQRLAPGTESEFGGHAGQADAFRQFLYFPASHATHGPPSGPVNPGEQKQMVSPAIETEFCGHDEHVSFDKACTAVANMFVGHDVHGTLLVSPLYLPAAHDLQSLRPLPPKPALHRHSVLSYASCEPLRMAAIITAMSAFDAIVCIRYKPARSKFGRLHPPF